MREGQYQETGECSPFLSFLGESSPLCNQVSSACPLPFSRKAANPDFSQQKKVNFFGKAPQFTSDLTAFWQGNGVAQSLNNIERVQVVSGPLLNPSGEETLDVEWSSGMASRAKVRIYATTDLAFVDLDQAYQTIINELPSQPTLHQISLSYGLGETYMPEGQMETDDQYFAAIAGAGVTVFVSSGDGGSTPGPNGSLDNSGPVQVESPADDPNVTGVGGTSLTLKSSTGAVISESAWFYGGGGSSQLFARPGWKIGAGFPTGANRLVPDVALAADPNTGAYLT